MIAKALKLRALRYDERKHIAWGDDWLPGVMATHDVRMGTLTTMAHGFRWETWETVKEPKLDVKP